MALIKCPDCGSVVSEHADWCPYCGCPSRLFTVSTRVRNPFRGTNAGDMVDFGSYPQTANGGKAPIKWRVLEVQGNKAFVISVMGLDCQHYNSTFRKGNDWKSSGLNTWLQTSFIHEAFKAEEQDIIEQVTMLTVRQALDLFDSDYDRRCIPTPYAKARGAYAHIGGECHWWLQSPGSYSSNAAFVRVDGYVDKYGDYVSNPSTGVRPALLVRL